MLCGSSDSLTCLASSLAALPGIISNSGAPDSTPVAALVARCAAACLRPPRAHGPDDGFAELGDLGRSNRRNVADRAAPGRSLIARHAAARWLCELRGRRDITRRPRCGSRAGCGWRHRGCGPPRSPPSRVSRSRVVTPAGRARLVPGLRCPRRRGRAGHRGSAASFASPALPSAASEMIESPSMTPVPGLPTGL